MDIRLFNRPLPKPWMGIIIVAVGISAHLATKSHVFLVLILVEETVVTGLKKWCAECKIDGFPSGHQCHVSIIVIVCNKVTNTLKVAVERVNVTWK